MSFLASIWAAVIEWFISTFLVPKAKEIAQEVESHIVAEKDKLDLEGAKSEDEKQKALKDIANHTFPKS